MKHFFGVKKFDQGFGLAIVVEITDFSFVILVGRHAFWIGRSP